MPLLVLHPHPAIRHPPMRDRPLLDALGGALEVFGHLAHVGQRPQPLDLVLQLVDAGVAHTQVIRRDRVLHRLAGDAERACSGCR